MKLRGLWTLLGFLALIRLGAQDSTGTRVPMPGLPTPPNWKTEVTYDPVTGFYILQRSVSGMPVGAPRYLTAADYQALRFRELESDFWQKRWAQNAGGTDRDGSSLVPDMSITSPVLRDIFGSDKLEIRPTGSAEIRFGLRYQHIKNPIVPERNRRTLAIDFDQKMQISAAGKLGDRLNLNFNFDTEATFAFENKIKLDFKGQEDDILKGFEMGDVSLPTNGSLITGVQSLFGLKTQMQFGKTTVTTVLAEQRSQSQSMNIQGGASSQEFRLQADAYEANRHFFLSQFFRDRYEQWVGTRPIIQSPVQITRVEVWVTNRRSIPTEVRNLVAFLDLGEGEEGAYRSTSGALPGEAIFPGPSADAWPTNRINRLDPQELVSRFASIRDAASAGAVLNSAGYDANIEYAQLTNARMLQPNEFSFHPQLGYLSLNTALNQDEVIAVAYQYTVNGRTYQVGEFSNDGIVAPKSLILKLLKHQILNVRSPAWDLMMKNVYNLNAFQISPEDFRLELLYVNDETGLPIPFLPKSSVKDQLLVQVLQTDKVNTNGDPFPDGLFDFVEGLTVLSGTGRIILPALEPFGSSLAKRLNTADERKRYVFQELYDSTLFRAQEQTQKNKFLLRGRYKSAGGSVIQLNSFNIPRGSISVTAGGNKLTENQDFTVDYALGQVRIINEAILQSGVPIRVSFENNSLFNFQAKTFTGATVSHQLQRNWTVGGSILQLREGALTQKVAAGEEPVRNAIWGLNTQYEKNLPGLTRSIDKLPFVSTKAPSSIMLTAEVAQLLPGSPRIISINGEPTTYIDDFESSQTAIDLRGTITWQLASIPEGQPERFPEASLSDNWASNYNRARLSWYVIDNSFFTGTAITPPNIRNNPAITSDHRQRMVPFAEVFPNITLDPSQARNINTFDLQFDPTERGPYNYDVQGLSGISAGLNPDGSLKNPRSRWGGIMRQLTINNFEEQNIEFVQFWVMDPFLDNPTAPGGDVYLHLGNVSEDILKDGMQSFEHGLPADGTRLDVDSSMWGYASKYQPVVDAFDNSEASRPNQDVGVDGLRDDDERRWLGPGSQTYLDRVQNVFGPGSPVYAAAQLDPAADNFVYYRGSAQDQADADILRRYRYFNNPDGNSRTALIDGQPAMSTNMPDKEDVNRDATLNRSEQYFSYRISMRPEDLVVGENYIADIYETTTDLLPDQTRKPVRWIQFKIPVFEPDQRINGAQDFRSIRFARWILHDWQEPVVLRMARLDLVRGEWRRYRFNLDASREMIPVDDSDPTTFTVNAVNLEENGGRVPVVYRMPPGLRRQVLLGNTSLLQQNEQSLSLRTCGLRDGDARAVFKNTSVDMRMNKRMKLFVHAEAASDPALLRDGDVRLFVRVGNDYSQNYYEYELPLTTTAWGATDEAIIWPSANDVDIEFALWTALKLERDAAMQTNPNISPALPYEKTVGDRTYRVVGTPNLGWVRTIMVGVRNPRRSSANQSDDGLDKCVELWVNELRMTDFDNRGGVAGLARGTAKLADLGQVALSGGFSTPGFGGIDMAPNERNKFSSMNYDVQTNLDLHRFLPANSRLRLPVFITHAQDWKTPMFNPYNPDIEMPKALANLVSQRAKDSLRGMVSDFQQRRAVAFTNVRIDRATGGAPSGRGAATGPPAMEGMESKGDSEQGLSAGGGASTKLPKKPRPWDVENLSGTYAFNEVLRRDANTLNDLRQENRGSLAYAFQAPSVNVQPFKNLKPKALAIIRDANVNLTPSRISVRADVLRSQQTMQMRNVDNPKFQLPITYNKNFTMDRNYNVIWDPTKSWKLDYTSRIRVRFDELPGPASADSVRDFLAQNLRSGGRPTEYHHTVNTTWSVPINKLPFMGFLQTQIRYTADLDWKTNSLWATRPGLDSLNFGNTVESSGKWNASANANMATFYNQIPGYSKLKKPARGAAPARSAKPATPQPSAGKGKDDKETKPSVAKTILIGVVDLATMLKSVNATASLNTGSLLPGFKTVPVFSGLTPSAEFAPGWQAALGLPHDLPSLASSKGWLLENPRQPLRATEATTQNITVRAQLEPIQDMRITLNANQTYGRQASYTYRYSTGTGLDSLFARGFHAFNPQEVLTYSSSWISWPTAFDVSKEPEYASAAYDRFRAARLDVSKRMADAQSLIDPNYVANFINIADSSRYGYDGFSVLHTDVLANAFLAAYGNRATANLPIGEYRSLPFFPNWNATYTGLMRLKAVRNVFTALSLSHAYTSTMTVAGLQTHMLRAQRLQDNPLDLYPRNDNLDILPERQVGQISVTESFSPLMGIDLRTKSNASFKLNYGMMRQLNLSMANNQLTESKSKDITVGVGYIIKDVQFRIVEQGGAPRTIKSNLELKLDVKFSDNQTVIRRILEDFNQPTAGQTRTTVKFTADYRLSRRLTAQFYYDQTVSKFKTSQAFPTNQWQSGVALRLNLGG
ncbi:MAG: cell surface protein SprA [Cryomorphaceae bacterium]|nr:cell surface protein SprA [Cryomorphaceae bacterium]